jgi:hypothetical protein
MSFLTSVRPYFRSRLLDLGFTEWTDGFNKENIPRSLLDGSFHIESGAISPTRSNHQVHEFTSAIVVSVFFKGYRNPAEAIERAISQSERILKSTLKASDRLEGDCIKDVFVGDINVSPLSASNDNAVTLEMGFNVITFNRF